MKARDRMKTSPQLHDVTSPTMTSKSSPRIQSPTEERDDPQFVLYYTVVSSAKVLKYSMISITLHNNCLSDQKCSLYIQQ